MHDILEGIAPLEVALILKSLIKRKQITLDQLNKSLVSWPYGPLDSLNKPVKISNEFAGKVKQTAALMWCLIRMLPLIGTFITDDCPEWQLLLLLKRIRKYVFASRLAKSHCAYTLPNTGPS